MAIIKRAKEKIFLFIFAARVEAVDGGRQELKLLAQPNEVRRKKNVKEKKTSHEETGRSGRYFIFYKENLFTFHAMSCHHTRLWDSLIFISEIRRWKSCCLYDSEAWWRREWESERLDNELKSFHWNGRAALWAIAQGMLLMRAMPTEWRCVISSGSWEVGKFYKKSHSYISC